MARRGSSEAAAPEGSVPEESAAMAAFEEWKKRMADMASGAGGRMDIHAGQPFPPPPYPYAMPAWPPSPPYPYGMAGYPPPPAAGPLPQPPVAPFSAPEQAGSPAGGSTSLFTSLGNMIRLGVEAVNAGLAGGMQLMEGFAGPGAYAEPGHHPYAHGCTCGHHGYDDYCHDPGYGYHGGCDCCCGPTHGHHGCTPSVRNC